MNNQLLNKKTIQLIVQSALKEDAAFHDLTTMHLIKENDTAEFSLIANNNGVICGIDLLKESMYQMSNKIQFEIQKNDGEFINAGDLICRINGPIDKILSAERVGLNFLQMLSGISSLTHQFVEKISSEKIIIRDTRKTRPMLRSLEKYAVLQGGGQNHRSTLDDFVLIKDNHLNWAKKHNMSIEEIVQTYRKKLGSNYLIELEVETIKDAKEALKSDIDILLLDNMDMNLINTICAFNRPKEIKIEISGNINIANIDQYSNLNIDYIAIGALIHSASFFDFSLELN